MIDARLSAQTTLRLGLLGLIWGASFMSIRVALDEVSVLSSVVHRVGWAALILWGVVLLRRLSVPRDPAVWVGFAVMGLLNNVLPFCLMAWGQLHIETGLTSILNAATAIFGVLAATVLLPDEKLTRRRAIGVGLGFAGVVTVMGWQALGEFDLRSVAQLAVLAGTVSYALAGVWARRRLSHLRPEIAAAGMLTASALILVPLTLIAEGNIDLPSSGRGIVAIAYYAGAATAIAYLLYYRLLARAGAATLLLVTLIIPPVAVLLGALILSERLGPAAFVGFALLGAGLLVLRGGSEPRAPARPAVDVAVD